MASQKRLAIYGKFIYVAPVKESKNFEFLYFFGEGYNILTKDR